MIEARISPFAAQISSVAKEVNGIAIRVNEIYANGSGGPKGMLEKMDARIDQLIKESWIGKEKTMTAMLNFMHIQEEEAKKNDMRAEIAKEYADKLEKVQKESSEKYERKQAEEAAKHEKRNKTIVTWIKWAVALALSDGAFDVWRTVWHTYHPIVVDHVINR